MVNRVFACGVLTVAAFSVAGADVIVNWNFNTDSVGSDPLNPQPNVGAGVAKPVFYNFTFGGNSYNGFNTIGWKTDQVTSDPVLIGYPGSDTAGNRAPTQQTWYLPQMDGNLFMIPEKKVGAEFDASTLGFKNVTIEWDQRFTGTSSRYGMVQYTLDGANWVDSKPFASLNGKGWYSNNVSNANQPGYGDYADWVGKRWSFNFGCVPGAGNNPKFGVRIVTAYNPATGTYTANDTYGGGSWRFDMVTISGTNGATLCGSVALANYNGTGLVPVILKVYQGKNLITTAKATITASDGSFSVDIGNVSGSVDVYAYVDQGTFLIHKTTTSVVNGIANASISLLNGDVDGNNVININDYAILSDQFNTSNLDLNFDPRPDLDKNGLVNINDYAILSDNFNVAGDLLP